MTSAERWYATVSAASPDRVVVQGRTVVGTVTLHNRSVLAARVGPVGSDLEMLARLYLRFGPAGLLDADGMYALAIVDGDDLVLIRDHVGARTVFYGRTGSQWVASPSLRTLRSWPGLDTGLNLAAVRSFLTFAYLPGAETLLRGISEVLPGRCLRLSPSGISSATYWEPAEHLSDAPPAQLALELRALLESATARRLPADEPVGVLLSGGIDSSLVTALAAKLHDHPVRTYSISFGADLPSELAYSGLVATHCNTVHRVLTVSGSVMAQRLAGTVALLDSPVGDPLTVPNLLLAEAVAADGLTVVLNGEGGDPVFGGPKNLPMIVHELQRPSAAGRADAYLRSYRKCYQDLPFLLTPAVHAALAGEPGPDRFVAPYLRPNHMTTLLNQLLYANLRTKGAHHILTKVERLTATNGIEGRSPLFDRAVIDHAFTVPPRFKLAGAVEKWILKQAVRDLLPSTIVDRPKSGMRVPVQQWLRGPLRELSEDILLGPTTRARGLFQPETIRAWLRGEGSVFPRQGGKLWLVLTLELWIRSFVDS